MEEKKEVEQQTAEQAQNPSEAPAKQSAAKKNGLARHIAFVLVAVLLVGGVGTSIGMNAWMMSTQASQNAKVSQYIDDERARQAEDAEQESSYQEDGFKVMDQYEIRSTTDISDAYLNGDPSGLSDEDKETYDMAVAVLDEVIEDGMSDYEKELAIYDWMVDNIGQGSGYTITMPGENTQAYTPHDVLKSKAAVCVGCATTFRLLCNMEGMEVHIVHNDYHSWDMVKLDDGEWYQVDVYSDVNGAKYCNFNMTDDQARNGHDWDDSALPEAKGTKYSYAVQNAKEVKDFFVIPKKVRAVIKPGKDSSLYYKFKNKLTDADLALADQMVQLMQQAICSMQGGENMSINAAWVDDGEDSYILAIYIYDYSDSSTSSLADADASQVTEMTNKVNEAFDSAVTDPNESDGDTTYYLEGDEDTGMMSDAVTEDTAAESDGSAAEYAAE